MNLKQFQLLLIALPLCAAFVFTGCSSEEEDNSNDKAKTEETQKPLVERDPQVKEYFKVLNEVVNEYVTLGETTLDVVEKLEKAELSVLDGAAATAQLLESLNAIQELEETLEQQGTIKENVEKNLNAKDMLEFKEMYSETMARVDSLSKRLDNIDSAKYLEGVDLF
ncbi:MAG: hypothetical protein ACFHU9_06250 [Fluviicola sp.]